MASFCTHVLLEVVALRFGACMLYWSAWAFALAAHPVSAYEGNLNWVLGDIKLPVAGRKGQLDSDNYQAIIDGLKSHLHCNGLRLHIDLSIEDPADYPQLYKLVIDYARAQSLVIYANPLGTGKHGLSKGQLVERVTRYANHFQPRFLGPFNESGYQPVVMKQIAMQIRAGLNYDPQIVGPDCQHVRNNLTKIQNNPGMRAQFDIIGAHNAVKDNGATPWAWWKLRQVAGKETWSTENPRPWSLTNEDGLEVGVKAVIDTAGPISGLVLYLAYPGCVTEDGSLTDKGQAIVQGIGEREDP